MLAFFCKKIRPVHGFVNGSWDIQLLIVPNAPPITKFFSSERKIATSSSSKNKVPENAELVKTLLRNYGFTNTQISKVVRIRPQILSSDPQKTILPKLEFFRSIGLSSTDIPRIICASHCQALLGGSLENQLIPCYNFLKSVLLLDEVVIKTLKLRPRILLYNVEKKIAPNVAALRGAGVPRSIIAFQLRYFPFSMHKDCHKFKECVNKAVEMGFDPMRSTFAYALQVFCEMRKTTLEHKMEVYRRCGFSNDEILLAFRSHPFFMNLSEGKIMETMDFLVNKMGWQPADVARCPVVLFFNLERRIIPRCTVVKFLQAEGLEKKDLCLSSILLRPEKCFLDRFVNKFQDNFPGLMNIYLGKI